MRSLTHTLNSKVTVSTLVNFVSVDYYLEIYVYGDRHNLNLLLWVASQCG